MKAEVGALTDRCQHPLSSGHRAIAGYLYFHAAPDAPSFHQECVKRVKNLHTSDCLRANK